ncbi:carboxypeptidase-like regulatory domain-containing protein [Aneurinibacillus sp. REN35]|uniref:carboxypeptidase-like regulatory domain-containing protein n=1 Tax=Aneurinibacillus sp. REN35 TaxID=3237286 RepID=UPI003528F663
MRRCTFPIVCVLLAFCLIAQLMLADTHVQAQTEAKAGLTPPPDTILVAIRESTPGGEPNPRGRILYVRQVPFNEYIRNVLPNEWLPSWEAEALKAGALAAKMFTWYHALHPVTIDNHQFAVDNTINFQLYREGTSMPRTNAAIEEVRDLAFVKPDDTIFEMNYRAGYPNSPNSPYRRAQKMAQHGSQYLASKQNKNMLEILQYYYEGKKLALLHSKTKEKEKAVLPEYRYETFHRQSSDPLAMQPDVKPGANIPGHNKWDRWAQMQVRVIDAWSKKPIPGAEVVIAENGYRSKTDSRGYTPASPAPIIHSSHLPDTLARLHGQLTLLVYKNGYRDTIHYNIQMNEGTTTTPEISIYPLPADQQRIEPYIYHHPTHHLFSVELSEQFRSHSQPGAGPESPDR